MLEASNDRSEITSDTDRSIESCVVAFAEFNRHLKFALTNCQKSSIRIGIQIQLGRVHNSQIGLNSDLHDREFKQLDDKELEKALQNVGIFFNEWIEDLTRAIASRKVGWLRLAVNVDNGSVLGWTLSPTFDMKSP